MYVSIEPCMSTVANTKGKGAPCLLTPLMELIHLVLGSSVGPSVPSFMSKCVVTGLIVLRQHPKLDDVQFVELPDEDDAAYYRWLNHQRQQLDLPKTLDIQPPTRRQLKRATRRAALIDKEAARA